MFYKEEDIVKEIVTSTARLRLLKMNLIHNSYLPNVDITPQKHMENHYALVELAGGNKLPILVDAAVLINFTVEAKKTAKELESITPTLKRAFVTNSLGHRMLINFFLNVFKPAIPNKVFSNYGDAVKWLQINKS